MACHAMTYSVQPCLCNNTEQDMLEQKSRIDNHQPIKQTAVQDRPAKAQEQLQRHLSRVQLYHGHAALQLRTVAAAAHCHHVYCCRPPQNDVLVATGHLSHLHPVGNEVLLARSTGIRKSELQAMTPRT